MSTKKSEHNYISKIVSLLKKLLTWQVFVGIATVIAAIIAVVSFYQGQLDKKSVETLINQTEEIKNTLQKSCNPNTINIENDTTGELNTIKDFQLKVLNYCNIYSLYLSSYKSKKRVENISDNGLLQMNTDLVVKIMSLNDLSSEINLDVLNAMVQVHKSNTKTDTSLFNMSALLKYYESSSNSTKNINTVFAKMQKANNNVKKVNRILNKNIFNNKKFYEEQISRMNFYISMNEFFDKRIRTLTNKD